MIHTIRTVAVGDQESKIDSPIILYRGDREVEVEFTINGSKFTFTNGGNVIKSTNATHGQLVINTPTGENMFSEVTECRDGKVVFVITKEMIDELIEVGFYSFQIRLFDESQVSRVTIPPVLKGIDIRNPIAAEDETNVVDIGLVDYAVVVKDEFEDLSTFLPDGNYNKTKWESKDVISGAKLNKIEDALYNINSNMEATDLALLNRVENINKTVHGEIDKLGNELESEVEEFERSLNYNVEQFKIDTNMAMAAHKNEVSEVIDSFDARLADIENIKTVQDLKNMSLKLDTVIQTCGYYEINDGGANTYIVIPSKEYSYDIECNDCAIRPIATSDTVCPKQFGTVNDGVNGDNIGLQACFDFVRDHNIGVIDGRNLLYTTDSSTRTYHDHYGVVIHQPVTLRNYRGQVKDDIGHLTSVIDILQVENDFREYLIENCEFNGKYGTVAQSTIGAEDGGRHCVCFYAESGKFPKEYVPMGNITIRNCRFIKPDAYGIFISPADCIYTVENCTFDTNGPCILSYATAMFARNCTATMNSSYKTMVLNFLHDEMEMAGNYQGNKLKSFYIDNCHSSRGCIVKTHNSPQGKLSYDKIVINNCSSTTLLEMYQTYTAEPTTINLIELYSSSGSISITGFQIDKIIAERLTNVGRMYIHSNTNIVEVNNFEFKKNQSIYISKTVQNLYLNKCKALESLDEFFDGVRGPDTSPRDEIVNLYITDFEWCDSSRVFDEIGIENIYIDNLHIYGVTKTGYDFIYNKHTEGCKKVLVKNSIFEIPTADWCYLIQNQNPSTGNAIIKDCVYTDRLSTLVNGMTEKRINVVNLNADSTQ